MPTLRHLLPALLLPLLCAQAPAPPSATPIQLFNGHDLSNWTWTPRPPKPTDPATQPAKLEDVFTLKDGLLHDAGKPIGYIRTIASYTNFTLTVEQRHVSRGNGGILFAISGPDKVWPHCFECQGQTGEEADLRGIANFHITADPARTEAKRVRHADPAAEKPAGEWETFEITVNHGHITLKLNGVTENTATTTDDLTGHIGIQAEGGEIEYRKIQLIPLE